MSFISWQYALFLPAVVLAYWNLGQRGRILLLCGANYFFYGMWDGRFLALLLASTAIDFHCGHGITGKVRSWREVFGATALPGLWLWCYPLVLSRTAPVSGGTLALSAVFPVVFTFAVIRISRWPADARRRGFLTLSILSNVGALVFFKYFNFFAASMVAGLQRLGLESRWVDWQIVLPIAISFYTFQSISYSVDIFRGKAAPIEDYPTFAAYLAFFPQLVAGPIERPAHLIPQLTIPREWSVEHLHAGARLLLGGFFKKLFVADSCGIIANFVFDPKQSLNAPWAMLGLAAFAVQIYADFSGYTDIARGSARLFGIELTNNFRFPYFAQNPSDFWRRWHISLSSWFRDYVYITLGGNRGTRWSTARNLFLTMAIAGLWHGASWNFVAWGAYHGALLVIWHAAFSERDRLIAGGPDTAVGAGGLRAGKPAVPDVPALADWPKVAGMLVLTLIGWALFRCKDLDHLERFFGFFAVWGMVPAGSCLKPLAWVTMHAAPLLLIHLLSRSPDDDISFVAWPAAARGVVYALAFLAVSTSAVNDLEFIYFQF